MTHNPKKKGKKTMATRYFEYERIAQNFEEWKNGYKPLGTLGVHQIEKITKRGDGFEILSNVSITKEYARIGWKNKVIIRPKQLLVYDCGRLKSKTPSKLGQFKIKILKFEVGDEIVTNQINSFQGTLVTIIAGEAEFFSNVKGEYYKVYNSIRNDGDEGWIAKTPGLFLVENSYRQRGLGNNSKYFAIVGNYKVTDDDIEKIKRNI